jgi:hypothetical protein
MRPTGLPGMALFVSFLSFESVPLGISIWWLILFSRKEIAAQFSASAGSGGSPEQR